MKNCISKRNTYKLYPNYYYIFSGKVHPSMFYNTHDLKYQYIVYLMNNYINIEENNKKNVNEE